MANLKMGGKFISFLPQKQTSLEKYTVVPIVEHYFGGKGVDTFNLRVKIHFKDQTDCKLFMRLSGFVYQVIISLLVPLNKDISFS